MTAEPSPVRQAQHRFLWRTAQVNQPRLTVENLSEYNVARTVARRAGASLLPAVRLSRRIDLLTRLIYVPLSDSRWGAQPRCRFCSILLTHVTYPLVLRRRSIQHRRNSTAGQLRGTTRRTRFQAWTDANPRGASVTRAARRPRPQRLGRAPRCESRADKTIETGEPMTRRNARLVAEYLREAGWGEGAIGAATAQAGAIGYLRETG
jgi:hypothetical protein